MNLAFSKSVKSEADIHFLLENYPQYGFEALHLFPNQFRGYLDNPQEMLDKYAANWGVALGLVNIGTLDEAAVDHLRQVLKFAQDMGTDSVIYCISRPKGKVDRSELRDLSQCFSELGREAGEFGLRLSAHNHVGQMLMNRDDLAMFIEAGDPDAFGLTLDTGHLAKAGEDVSEVIHQFRDCLHNIHLQDFADGEFRCLGSGSLDYHAILEMTRSIGFSGWICVEDQSQVPVEEALKSCQKHLVQYDI